jgi:hypothetical protein
MTSTRSFLATTAVGLAALVALGAPAPAHAADTAPTAGAGPTLDLSVDQDHGATAKRCRWVKRIGLVCDTENGTITL